jgi:hypothetical protein
MATLRIEQAFLTNKNVTVFAVKIAIPLAAREILGFDASVANSGHSAV